MYLQVQKSTLIRSHCQIPYRYKEGRDREQDVSPMSIAPPLSLPLWTTGADLLSFLPLPLGLEDGTVLVRAKEVLINRILRPSIHSLGGGGSLSRGGNSSVFRPLSFALSPRV